MVSAPVKITLAVAFPPGNLKNLELASKNNLNDSHSPKVTIETFHEQSKAKFQSAFFSGTYQDRVYVESLGSFRDRVIVDEEETRFIKNLRSVLKKNKKKILIRKRIKKLNWGWITSGPIESAQ